jgi:hypothetical protein
VNAYKRHPNSGPVPYPDRSGMLLHDEIVYGEEWEPFVALDYVVRVEVDAPATAEVSTDPVDVPVVIVPQPIEPVVVVPDAQPEKQFSDHREAQRASRRRRVLSPNDEGSSSGSNS